MESLVSVVNIGALSETGMYLVRSDGMRQCGMPASCVRDELHTSRLSQACVREETLVMCTAGISLNEPQALPINGTLDVHFTCMLKIY